VSVTCAALLFSGRDERIRRRRGSTCPVSASSCIGIPAGIAKLVADLRALDQRELEDPSCSGVHK
jgi:hypothetical protein